MVLMRVALALLIIAPAIGLAADPALDSKAQKSAPSAFAKDTPQPVLDWGAGAGKSHLVPALDILCFDFLLNQFNRHFIDSKTYGSNLTSFRKNLTGKWVYDTDPFATNQFLHPYQGSMYHGFARSAGLGFWQSLGYTTLGSALWETAGETDPPSINDQITTSFGGAFLGEPLFRMASLLLESGSGMGFWRNLGAAALSPATAYNRLAYGERFDGVFRSNNPPVYTLLQLGLNINATVSSNQSASPPSYSKGEAIVDATIAYGLPGKPGYSYTRPFDYFHFQFTAASGNVFENIISRGLLYGTDYALGDSYRGVWGLYGTYDYIAPQIFRISTSAAAFGTTAQWWPTAKIAWQGTLLAGVGYGSAGTISGVGQRDYHSGITPQLLVNSRVIFSDKAAVDLELRDYRVSGQASSETGGSENIARGVMALSFRVYKLHGVTLKYAFSHRDAHYPNVANTRQSVGAISIGYSYLGQTRFGAVDWRPKAEGGP
jgi:hypothetical protein